jgi:antigen 43
MRGGTASQTTIGINGSSIMFGVANATVIVSGGLQVVEVSGEAFGTVIHRGGSQSAFEAAVNATTISSGGEQFLDSHSVAFGTVNGGTEYVGIDGATISALVVSGGLEVIRLAARQRYQLAVT